MKTNNKTVMPNNFEQWMDLCVFPLDSEGGRKRKYNISYLRTVCKDICEMYNMPSVSVSVGTSSFIDHQASSIVLSRKELTLLDFIFKMSELITERKVCSDRYKKSKKSDTVRTSVFVNIFIDIVCTMFSLPKSVLLNSAIEHGIVDASHVKVTQMYYDLLDNGAFVYLAPHEILYGIDIVNSELKKAVRNINCSGRGYTMFSHYTPLDVHEDSVIPGELQLTIIVPDTHIGFMEYIIDTCEETCGHILTNSDMGSIDDDSFPYTYTGNKLKYVFYDLHFTIFNVHARAMVLYYIFILSNSFLLDEFLFIEPEDAPMQKYDKITEDGDIVDEFYNDYKNKIEYFEELKTEKDVPMDDYIDDDDNDRFYEPGDKE